jgi:hypothetical protein
MKLSDAEKEKHRKADEAYEEKLNNRTVTMRDLHPDLKPYIYNCPHLGRRLLHPLVEALLDKPYHEVTDMDGTPTGKVWNEVVRANLAYEAKRKCLVEYAAKRDWFGYVMAHVKPYRVVGLLDAKCEHGIKGREFGEAIRTAWTMTEFVHSDRRLWRPLWATPNIELGVMDDEERAALAALPDVVTVYRGTGHPRERQPLSWTLDKEKARWFAKRFQRNGYILTGKVKKADIRALLLVRKESEIVALRVRRVAIEPLASQEPVSPGASVFQALHSDTRKVS